MASQRVSSHSKETLSRPSTKNTRHGRLFDKVLILSTALIVMAAACANDNGNHAGPSASEPVPGGDFVYVLPDSDEETLSLDPSVDPPRVYGHLVNNAIYDSLFVQNPETGELTGVLATGWEVSEDGLEYEIELRDDVTFHDGTPFNAEAVKYSLDRARSPDNAPMNAYPTILLAGYDSTEIVDDYSIVIHMREPQANFLESALARDYMGIVSPTAAEDAGIPEFGRNPVGTGPFKFVEWVAGSHIALERNEEYHWAPEFAKNEGPAYPDTLTFRYIPEPSTRVSALVAGEVTAINGVPEADVERIESSDEFELFRFRKNGKPAKLHISHISPPMDERAVRLALAYAIDKEGLVRTVYHDVHVPAHNLLEERMWAVNKDAMIPPGGQMDKDEARRVLDEAGWTEGGDGIRVKNGQRLTLTAMTPPPHVRALEFIKEDVRQVGIELDITPMSPAALTDAIMSGDFHIVLREVKGWTNEDPHTLMSRHHSSAIPPDGSTNSNHWSSPEVDDLVERGFAELDRDRREQLYMEAQEILADEVVEIPLLSQVQIDAVRTGVHDLQEDIRGTYRYWWDIWMDPTLH